MTYRLPSILRTVSALFALLAGMFAAAAQAEPYRLVSQDRIALRVVEWHSGEGELKDWTPFTGNFLVDESGTISLPIVGTVEAAGLTAEELSVKIADLLQKNSGLAERPSASVEIATYGPIYVSGQVENPGQYPFSPGLTVMKAISLAGGFRKDEPMSLRLERERIQAAGTLGTTQLDFDALVMRRARLIAEKEERTSFEMPAELQQKKSSDRLHADEAELMRLRQVELDRKVTSSRSLAGLYSKEIDNLSDRITVQQRQVDLVKAELKRTNSLVKKRLVATDRQFWLDREVTETENTMLELRFQLLRARQLHEENNRDAEELINTRNSEVQTELNDVGRQIAKAEFEMRVARLLVDETDYVGRQRWPETSEGAKVVKFQISRRGEKGETIRLTADADTSIRPRDLIEVAEESVEDTLATGAVTPDRSRLATTSTEGQ